ncbi:MAG: PP2C family serine/threonine-protein phosphatase [Bacteroidota bacterium]|jgi:serine/threonine protein phosphatase PrpC
MEKPQRHLYITQLLKQRNVEITDKHSALLDSYIDSAEVIEQCRLISSTAETLIMNWEENIALSNIREKLLQLPNGTVDKAYSQVFSLPKYGLEKIKSFHLEFPQSLGIIYDPATGTISGTPLEQGEFRVKMIFTLDVKTNTEAKHEKEISLVINPDPKKLWKNIPSPTDAPYWKDDETCTSAAILGHQLVVASKRGRSHAHEGIFRDDDFGFFFDEQTGYALIAVADGAGSAKFSRKGSKIACDGVVNYFKNISADEYKQLDDIITAYHNLKDEASKNALNEFLTQKFSKAPFEVHQQIANFAAAAATESGTEVKLKDFSTTLLFVLLRKFDFGYSVMSFMVGDGGMGIYRADDNEINVLGTPDGGEFAGQTRFLTMPEIFADNSFYKRIGFRIVSDFTAIILMSDGITDPKFQTDANLGRIEKWHELWKDLGGENADGAAVQFAPENENAATQLLSWMDFWSPGNHDDRTIAVLY